MGYLDGYDYTEGGPNQGVCEVGNPCDVGTGAKLIRETDYVGPGLELTRTFNSMGEIAWTHNFSGYFIPDGSAAGGLVTTDGRDEPFKSYGSGKFVSFTGSGIEARLVSGEWVVSYASGAKDFFNSAGKLLRRANAEGQVTLVNRDSDGRIETIEGPFGHTLTFEHTEWGALSRVTDPAGEEILYDYDSQRRLVAVSYHYEDNDYPSLGSTPFQRTVELSGFSPILAS
jgi:YD repeat-containing protein